jgi:hypothetical protein
MKQATHEIQLRISPDDADLLMVALWRRTHDSATPADYAHLRHRLRLQICAQGPDTDAQPRQDVTP